MIPLRKPQSSDRPPLQAVGQSSFVHKDSKPSWLAGRAFSGRAELRHANLILLLVNLALLFGCLYTNFLWYRYAQTLSDKQYVVFHDHGGVTTTEKASDFRSGPSDEEIHGLAFQVARWTYEAGSNNYQTAFAEARAMMDQTMQRQFDDLVTQRVAQLKELSIYRKLEHAHVRPLEPKDIPAGIPTKPTRYDVVVEGVLDTYRMDQPGRYSADQQNRISTGPVAVWVRLTPLERRTEQNPAGLLVSRMYELDPGAQQANTPSPQPTTQTPNTQGVRK